MVCAAGWLIHAAPGSLGGWGGLRNRLGCAAWVSVSVRACAVRADLRRS